jgi:hypothetical protein
MATKLEAEREKAKLPWGCGRFGKAIDKLVDIADPDEELLGSVVAVNPKCNTILASPLP